jgi:hypothetical protein
MIAIVIGKDKKKVGLRWGLTCIFSLLHTTCKKNHSDKNEKMNLVSHEFFLFEVFE